MHFRGPGGAQEIDDAGAGGAPDDGIVDHDDPLAPHHLGDGVQFEPHQRLPGFLPRGNKGAPDVLVFDEADAVRDAGGPGIAHGGVQPGIRHADDHVRGHGMPLRQARPRPDPGGVDVHPVDDGVRPGKIDILKDTGTLFGLSAVVADAAHAVSVEHQDLAGQQVAHEFCLQGVQRAALGGDDVAPVGGLAVTERAEPVLVPHGDELGRGHDDEGVRALDPVHGAVHRRLDGRGADALLGDDVGNDLGIAGGVENGALHLQRPAQLHGVHQIAVVGQRHAALDVVDHDGLAVFPPVSAGGAVAHMAHGHGAAGKGIQHRLCEHLIEQARVLIVRKQSVVVHHDAAALLPPVLEGVEPVIGAHGEIGALRAADAQHAAFLVQLVGTVEKKLVHLSR